MGECGSAPTAELNLPNCDLCLLAASKHYVIAKLRLVAEATASREVAKRRLRSSGVGRLGSAAGRNRLSVGTGPNWLMLMVPAGMGWWCGRRSLAAPGASEIFWVIRYG